MITIVFSLQATNFDELIAPSHESRFSYIDPPSDEEWPLAPHGIFRVCMVSLANLCRSPIAAAIFEHVAKERNISHLWTFDSAALGVWYLGCNVDIRAVQALANHGIVVNPDARTKQIWPKHYKNYDIILGADRDILAYLRDRTPLNFKGQVDLITWYDPLGAEKLVEPLYDDYSDIGGFMDVANVSFRAANNFFDMHKDPWNPIRTFPEEHLTNIGKLKFKKKKKEKRK